MPEHNVELLRRFIEVYNARDIDAIIACFDPSIEFNSVFATAGGGVYHGHDGVRKYFRDMKDSWDENRAGPEAYFDLGEHTSWATG